MTIASWHQKMGEVQFQMAQSILQPLTDGPDWVSAMTTLLVTAVKVCSSIKLVFMYFNQF